MSSESREIPIWLDIAAIALLLTATLKIMANATISPALPALEASFPDEPAAAYLTRFLVSAPSLTVVIFAPIVGVLADRIGKLPLLIAGVILFVVSGSAGAYLPDLWSILISRFVLGIAVALTATAQVALIGDFFDQDRRDLFMGWQTAVINFGGFLFISGAGVLAGMSPRLPFLVYLLPLFLIPLLVSLSKRAGHVSSGKSRQGNAIEALGSDPWFVPGLALGLLTGITIMLFFLMPSQLPYYLESVGKDGASGTGFGLGVLTLTGGVTAMLFSRLKERLGGQTTLALGYALMGAGYGCLVVAPHWFVILAGTATIGAGFALVQPSLFVLALCIAPAHRRGSVSGILTTTIFLGQVASPLVFTPVIFKAGFQWLFAGTALAFLSLGLVAFASVRLLRSSSSAG